MDRKNFPTCNDIVRSSKRQSSVVKPDRPATQHSGMGQASVAIMVQGKRPRFNSMYIRIERLNIPVS